MKQAVAYLRKSRVTNDRHVSWEVQERQVRELAARDGHADLMLLSDWSRSGREEKTSLRGDYLRLRKMIEAGEVHTVYSYSLSRLARSLTEYASFAKLCEAQSVRVVLAKEGVMDYSSASGRFNVGILALLAQMEAELAQERARDTITARRARGDHIGAAGYGKRLVRGKLVEAEGENVDTVADAYREAGSFAGAARLLNARGVPTKRNLKWSGSVVRDILRGGRPQVLRGVRVEPRVAQRGKFILSRLLVCPCGNVMTGRASYTKTKYGTYGPYVSYQCYRGRYEPDHGKPYMIAERELLAWVKAEEARKEAPPILPDADADAGHREVLEGKRLRWIEQYGEGLIDKATRDRHLAVIDAELSSLGSAELLQALPAIEWDTDDADTINFALRALWRGIRLDEQLRPIAAEWLVPAWRA